MSEAGIRRLVASRKFNDLQVPAGFDQNVGSVTKRVIPKDDRPADMSDLEAQVLGRKAAPKFVQNRGTSEPVVENAGLELVARFKKAEEQVGGKKVKGDPLAPLAEHVSIVARNARDGGDGTPTVIADVSAALLALKPQTRDMILRRAGNPEVFEPLRNSALPEPEAGDGTLRRTLAVERARGKVDAEDKAIAESTSTKRLPAIKRFSAHFAQPDSMGKSGKITASSEQYKKFEPRNRSPMDVTADSAKSSKDMAIRSLAGDQLSQLREVQFAQIRELGYSDDQIRSMSRAQRDELVPFGEGAQKLTVGTDPNYWKPGDRRNRTADRSGATTGDVIDRRNKGNLDRVVEMLYMKTQPKPAVDASTGQLKLIDEAGKPMKFADPADTTIDLDRFFPWWRARFATLDKKGNLVYPDRLPSAEFVTGLIESTHGITDPDFFDRVLPLVRRSIEAAPDTPDPNLGAGGRGRTAHEFSKMVFLPSESFMETMKGGVGTKDMPYEIYGPRKVQREPVTAPERHPFQGQGAEAPAAKSKIEEFRRRMAEPGSGDQSSIYKLPQHSPMRSLLA